MNKKHLVAGLAAAALASLANAASVDYTVTGLGGSWAWGDTEWNDLFGAGGAVNDTTQVGTVNTLFHSAYVYAAPGSATPNGIYNYPSSGSVTFSTGNTTFDSLTVLSSRSYSPDTSVEVDYSADNGQTWNVALDTTTGALGWHDVGTAGSATESITMNLGGVVGDELRFAVDGAQVSLHSVSIDGVSAVPEPGSLALMLAGLGAVGLVARRRAK